MKVGQHRTYYLCCHPPLTQPPALLVILSGTAIETLREDLEEDYALIREAKALELEFDVVTPRETKRLMKQVDYMVRDLNLPRQYGAVPHAHHFVYIVTYFLSSTKIATFHIIFI